jgi:hypothetical protein
MFFEADRSPADSANGAKLLKLSPAAFAELIAPLSAADDGLARLDERLRISPVRDGLIARTEFAEACAALWAEGELVQLEDLVLHDAGMDIRSPVMHSSRRTPICAFAARRRAAIPKPSFRQQGSWRLSEEPAFSAGWAASPMGQGTLRLPTRRTQTVGAIPGARSYRRDRRLNRAKNRHDAASPGWPNHRRHSSQGLLCLS